MILTNELLKENPSLELEYEQPHLLYKSVMAGSKAVPKIDHGDLVISNFVSRQPMTKDILIEANLTTGGTLNGILACSGTLYSKTS